MSETIQMILGVEFEGLIDANGEIYSDLYESMTGEELDSFLERAHKNGGISPHEWEYLTERKPRIGDILEVARLMHEVYQRLGLIIPLYVAGKGGEA